MGEKMNKKLKTYVFFYKYVLSSVICLNTHMSTLQSLTAGIAPPTQLAVANPHPRDVRIRFYEDTHTYTIDEGTGGGMDGVKFTSVTTWNHGHFEEFDADQVITRMMASSKWPDNVRYYGKTREEIKAMWDENRDTSAAAGTAMHYAIECFYNGCLDAATLEAAMASAIEFRYFMSFHQQWCGNLRPYRTEWTVFHEEARLSGSIDMVYENMDPETGEPTGTLSIYDWKRCRQIVKSSAYGKFAITTEIQHLPDTNYWHYCLQLNTYKYILECKYGKVVTDLYLVCLHPENANQSYIRIRVVDLQQEVADLVHSRISGLEQAERLAAEAAGCGLKDPENDECVDIVIDDAQ